MNVESRSKVADWTTIICGPLSLILPIALEIYKHYVGIEATANLNNGFVAFGLCFIAFALFAALFIKVPKMLENRDLDMEPFQIKWMFYIAFGICMLFAISWLADSFLGIDSMGTAEQIVLIIFPLFMWLVFGVLYVLNKI